MELHEVPAPGAGLGRGRRVGGPCERRSAYRADEHGAHAAPCGGGRGGGGRWRGPRVRRGARGRGDRAPGRHVRVRRVPAPPGEGARSASARGGLGIALLAQDPTRYSRDWWIGFAIAIAISIAIAIVVSLVVGRYVRRYRRRAKETGDDTEGRRRRRLTTVVSLAGGIVVVIAWLMVGLTILRGFNVSLGPLVLSAGIAGVALGFGAQTLVRDTISGLFIVLERQYDIGDVLDLETDGRPG